MIKNIQPVTDFVIFGHVKSRGRKIQSGQTKTVNNHTDNMNGRTVKGCADNKQHQSHSTQNKSQTMRDHIELFFFLGIFFCMRFHNKQTTK